MILAFIRHYFLQNAVDLGDCGCFVGDFLFSESWTIRRLNRHFNFVGAFVGAFYLSISAGHRGKQKYPRKAKNAF
jgi:hypothetical protein